MPSASDGKKFHKEESAALRNDILTASGVGPSALESSRHGVCAIADDKSCPLNGMFGDVVMAVLSRRLET